jgi:hypothetical protein
VVLNESVAPKAILSEGLKYHLDNARPLTEHVYRAGSDSYFNLWAEARALYSRNIIEVQGDDLEVITETDLGHFGLYEGKKVPLDFVFEEIEEELNEIAVPAAAAAAAASAATTATTLAAKAATDSSTLTSDQLLLLGVIMGIPAVASIVYNSGVVGKIKDWINNYKLNGVIKRLREDPEVIEFIKSKKPGIQNLLKSKLTDKEQKYLKQISWDKITKGEIKEVVTILQEAAKKNPPLGKPKRGGSKKFYVYVRDPRTKKIKKVSFGDTSGLSAKINNPEARRAFAKRHDCANKKDKTKASYWSCRLPRYAKLLGLKSNFSGFW